MGLKEFFKPSWRKILLFLLPMIFLAIVYAVSLAINSDEWKINDSPINYVVFHFPCSIEKKLFCDSANCCFKSTETQIESSLIFYVPWFLFSWFIVWANEKVELRGYFWRKMHEKETPSKEVKSMEKVPVEEGELIKKEQLIKEEEERIKQEKEQIYKTIEEVNIKKLMEMGLDVSQDKIRCSNCKNWEPIKKKNLGNMVKKYGMDIIWKYKCKNCKNKC